MTALADLEARGLRLKRRIRSLGRAPTPEEAEEFQREAAEIRQGVADAMVERLIVNRPEVLTHGRPASAEAARRGLDEARARLRERRPESRCPAASLTPAIGGGFVVLCGVEDSLLSSTADPQSILTFCCGDHLACPSWQASKEAEWASRDLRTEIGA
jgi:hypothetical protein